MPSTPTWALLRIPAKATPLRRALDELADRPLDRYVGQAVAVVDQAGAGALGHQGGMRRAVGAPIAQHGAIEWHARHAVGGQAVLLGVDQVARRGLGHARMGARALERRAGELKQFLRGRLPSA